MKYNVNQDDAISAYVEYATNNSWIRIIESKKKLVFCFIVPASVFFLRILINLFTKEFTVNNLFNDLLWSYMFTFLIIFPFSFLFIYATKHGLTKNAKNKNFQFYGEYELIDGIVKCKNFERPLRDFDVFLVNGGVALIYQKSFISFIPNNIWKSIAQEKTTYTP